MMEQMKLLQKQAGIPEVLLSKEINDE